MSSPRAKGDGVDEQVEINAQQFFRRENCFGIGPPRHVVTADVNKHLVGILGVAAKTMDRDSGKIVPHKIHPDIARLFPGMNHVRAAVLGADASPPNRPDDRLNRQHTFARAVVGADRVFHPPLDHRNTGQRKVHRNGHKRSEVLQLHQSNFVSHSANPFISSRYN